MEVRILYPNYGNDRKSLKNAYRGFADKVVDEISEVLYCLEECVESC
jgi:hypothetical protein